MKYGETKLNTLPTDKKHYSKGKRYEKYWCKRTIYNIC